MSTVADLLVETLQATGVKTCYGIVGDTLNRIAHAISGRSWATTRRNRFSIANAARTTTRICTFAGGGAMPSASVINSTLSMVALSLRVADKARAALA